MVEQRARSLDLEPHQLGESLREPECLQIGLGIAELLAILARQVDPTDGQVACHVLPEVRKLQRSARGVGQVGVLGGMRTGHMEHQMTDRVGRSRAIVHELRIGLVFRDRLILHERVDERLERVDRNPVARDGLGQRNHDRMPRLALVHGPQLAAPPFQKLERSRGVADLVAQVV